MSLFGIPTGGHTYYVVFDKRRTTKNRWWHYVLDEKFSHCFLLVKVAKNKTLMINPLHWGIYNNIINCSIEESLLLFQQENVTKIIEVTTQIKNDRQFNFRGLYSCVSIVKAILNVGSQCITPKQLYSHLKKQGGKTVG